MMDMEEMILVNDFCTHHSISYTFISKLCDAELIEVAIVEEQQYLKQEQMDFLEKLVNLHTELDINTAGVEAIAHMLLRIEAMQEEMKLLRQRLYLYEGE